MRSGLRLPSRSGGLQRCCLFLGRKWFVEGQAQLLPFWPIEGWLERRWRQFPVDRWCLRNCLGTNSGRWVLKQSHAIITRIISMSLFSYRTVYFHPLASTTEFSVNSAIWQNKTVATDPHSYHLYKVKIWILLAQFANVALQIEGNKGDNSQTTASDLDTKTNVLFLTQLNRDGVACWNTKKPLQSENVALFAHDPEGLVFTNDIKVKSLHFIIKFRYNWWFRCRLTPSAICGFSPTRCRCLFTSHSTLNSTITEYLRWTLTMPSKIQYVLTKTLN